MSKFYRCVDGDTVLGIATAHIENFEYPLFYLTCSRVTSRSPGHVSQTCRAT